METVLKRWWLVLLATAVAAGVGAFLTAREPSRYEASNLMVVLPSPEIESREEIIRGLDTLERRSVLATFARLASTGTVLNATLRHLALADTDLAPFEVRGKVLPNRNMIEIQVSGPEPERAANIANAVAEVTRLKAESLYRVYRLEVVDVASPQLPQAKPALVRSSMASGVLGLFLGILATLFLHRVETFRTWM
jgi:capsular polysaccharide biosynthesis protein